jgi:hypothetical protein
MRKDKTNTVFLVCVLRELTAVGLIIAIGSAVGANPRKICSY